MMSLLKNILLALVWTMLTGDMAFGNLMIGFVLGYFVLHFERMMFGPHGEPHKTQQIFWFTFYFAWEVFRSAMRVAYDVVTPTLHATPGIVAVPLDAKTPVEITCLCNAITLTPGTLSLDISEDQKTLYVHALFADDPDAVRRQIKQGIERRLLEVLR
jgi:multicomponent Na+:H+ antiporter subunit E